MKKRDLFLKIGLGVAKTMVPGVALVEDAVTEFRTGKDKREAVLKMAEGAVDVSEFMSNKDLVNDVQFQMGLRMINDGNVLIMQAVNRHAPEDAEP